jgi:plastocyanin
MFKKSAALAVALVAAVLAACGGHSAGTAAPNSVTYALPGMPDLTITARAPQGATSSGTISEELPTEGLGTIDDPHWKATLGGFTQEQFSQALGFAPGTEITIKNISSSITHTLDVVAKIKGAPAKFPPNPKLPLNPSGGELKKGYASGPIDWGSSVKVTLGKTGIYLIGCHFHYHEGMQDVLVVANGATPGPQATAPPAR